MVGAEQASGSFVTGIRAFSATAALVRRLTIYYFLYHFRFLFVWTIEYVVRSFLPNGVFSTL